MTVIDAPYSLRCELGEGPSWDPASGRLTYVDIDAGTVHRLDAARGTATATGVEPPISFAIPVAGGSRWVGGTGADLTLFDGDDAPIGSCSSNRIGRPTGSTTARPTRLGGCGSARCRSTARMAAPASTASMVPD